MRFRNVALLALALFAAARAVESANPLNGDCVTDNTTKITCTKSNGVLFGSAAFLSSSTFLARASNLSDLASASAARTNLGLGTAAVANTGTSGASVPLLSSANAWAAAQTYNGGVVVGASSPLSTSSPPLFPPGSLSGTSLASTAVTPGTYTNTTVTVDQQGRLTAASSGAAIAINPNLVDNADFVIDQQNEDAAVTLGNSSVRVPDRWFHSFIVSTSGASSPTVQVLINSPTCTGSGGGNCLKWTAPGTAATSTPAGFLEDFGEAVEGSTVAFLEFGGGSVAGILTVTVSIRNNASTGNVVGVALQNSAASRSYVHNCTLGTAGTTTVCSFTLTADSVNTWLKAPGTVGLRLFVTLGCGATYQTAADVWAIGTFYCTSSQTNFLASNTNTLEFNYVKMESGSAATPFVSEVAATAITKAQRYYAKTFPAGTAPAQSAGVAGAECVKNPIALGDPSAYVQFQPPMYASPTVTTFNPSAANANWRDVTAASDSTVAVDPASAKGTTGILLATSGTVTTLGDILCIHMTADAGL